MPSRLRRVLADPLCHFFLIAAVLVAAQRLLAPATDPRPLLAVEQDRVALAVAAWAETQGRQPERKELTAILDELEAEALLLAEAQARGLDRYDPEVRTRLTDLAVLAVAGDAPEPDEASLRAWFDRQPERWQHADRLVLEQVPVGEAEPAALRRQLEDGLDPYDFATGEGLPVTLGPLTRSELADRLGPDFVAAVWDLPEQSWSEPVAAGSERHLVRIVHRFSADRADFEDLRSILAEAWQREAFARRREQAVAELRRRYRVIRPESEP